MVLSVRIISVYENSFSNRRGGVHFFQINEKGKRNEDFIEGGLI